VLSRRSLGQLLAGVAALAMSGEAAPAREKLERLRRTAAEALRRIARDEQSRYGWYDENGVRQGGLIAFVRYFWHVLEPETPFVDGWPLWVMCEHLEGVTRGEITHLLVNVPPGFMKSLLVDVFWPAWEWGPMDLAHLRYVAFSYSASLTERDNGRFRDLITSPGYVALYKGVRPRNKTTLKVHNTRTGWKLASSVGGVGTGERGDRIILDDPHNVKEAESDTVREETVRWFRESLSSRFNNENTAFIVIMQRVHEDDVSGVILSAGLGYCHVCIPWEYEYGRCVDAKGDPVPNSFGWVDPRLAPLAPDECEGLPAWEARFPPKVIDMLRHALGPYAWAGQYQQAPSPRGGGIFQRDWWQLWESDDGKFPTLEYVVASLDGAFTEDEENDPSALTVWGVFINDQNRRRVILLHAWRKFLKFSGPRIAMEGGETKAAYRRRCMPEWGLIEWTADTCRRFKVDLLLIEGKASGMSAADELRGRYGFEGWGIHIMPVKGDKVARALAVQPIFSQFTVYAPDRDWAEMVIDEMAVFPKGKYDDLTDSATQAMGYLRGVGMVQSDEEAAAAEIEPAVHKPRQRALYPV